MAADFIGESHRNSPQEKLRDDKVLEMHKMWRGKSEMRSILWSFNSGLSDRWEATTRVLNACYLPSTVAAAVNCSPCSAISGHMSILRFLGHLDGNPSF